MAGDANRVTVKARVRILKFAEGADPNTDAPYDIEEKEVVLTGEDAERAIREMGGNINGIN